MNKRKMFFHMITASLLRRKSRMIVALLATAIGATILSGLIAIYRDVPKQMAEQFRNYGANVLLTSDDGALSDEVFNASISCISPDDLVGATPYQYQAVRIHEQPIQASGTDFVNLQKTSPYWVVDGEYPTKSKEILLGTIEATNLNLGVGDVITVSYTPEDLEEMDSMIDFKVTGIVSTGGDEEKYVYMSLEDLANLTQKEPVYDVAELSISATTEGLDEYVSSISEEVDGAKASLIKRVTASEATVLTKLQSLVLLVTVIVLALTMICVTTTMTAVVSERRKEIGLRKAIGASDRSIFMEFMGEGIVLGFGGGVIGGFLGFGFAQFVSMNVFNNQISMSWGLFFFTIFATMLVTALACITPIQSATKIDAALVLKGE